MTFRYLLLALAAGGCTTHLATFEEERLSLAASDDVIFLAANECDDSDQCRYVLWTLRDGSLERVFESELDYASSRSIGTLHALSATEVYFTIGDETRIVHYRDGEVTYLELGVVPYLASHGEHVYADAYDGDDVVLWRIDGDEAIELRREPTADGYNSLFSVLEDGNVIWQASESTTHELDPNGDVVRENVGLIVLRHALEGGDVVVSGDYEQTLSVTSAAGTLSETFDGPFIGIVGGTSTDNFDFAVIEARTHTNWRDISTPKSVICIRHFDGARSSEVGCTEMHGSFHDYIVHDGRVIYAYYDLSKMWVDELTRE